MPRVQLKLTPGVDLLKTLNLNEAAISDSNLIRFLPDRNGMGLVQKMGGWIPYYGYAISSTVRSMRAYNDLNSLSHLALGCIGPPAGSSLNGSLQILTNGNLVDVTPQFRANYSTSATNTLNTISYVIQSTGSTDFTSVGASSNNAYSYFTATGAATGTGIVVPAIKISTQINTSTVTITDTEIPATENDFIEFKEPISLGGIVFQGPYQTTQASGSGYTINVGLIAASTEYNYTFTSAPSLQQYRTYVIQTTGTTNWNAIGSASTFPGAVFLSNAITPTGTGTARLLGVPAYALLPGNTSVTVYLDNHTYGVGSDYYIADPVTINNVTLAGSYIVTSIGSGPTASTFTIQAPFTASATLAGAFVIGQQYIIQTVGTTNFTAIGASSNTVGVVFVATGVGSGTGTAYNPNPVPANSGMPNTNFYISPGAQNQSLGYGSGGYGAGGYGTGVTSTISAGSFTIGTQYQIVTVGTTNFILIGAANNTVGTIFTATGVGSGTGTASVYYAGYAINATDWSLDNFGQILVAVPVGGPVYTYQFNTALSNANLPSAQAPLINDGAFVAMPERQIVAWGSSFGLEQDPLLIRWSDVQDSTTWIGTATNQAGSIRIPTGNKIVTCIQGPQQAFIWTDVDCYSMQYIGPPLVYGVNKIGSNCGAISRKSVGQFMNNIYWMSQKQFFMNRGNGPEPLPCPVWDFIYQTLNNGGGVNVSAGSFIAGKSYVIVSTGNGTTDFTTIGASANVVGSVFVATGAGTGSGTAYLPPYTSNIRCAINTLFNEIIWYFPSTAYASLSTYAGFLTVGLNYTIGYVGNTDWTLLGASSNTVGVSFVATGVETGTDSDPGWANLTSSIGENNAYVKYNVVTQQWDVGYNVTKVANDQNLPLEQFVGRTSWVDQSVLGLPVGTGLDNFIYQHENGYDAYQGNTKISMTPSFSTGYFQLSEADQLVFVDQIWPDFKWGLFAGDPTVPGNALIGMYIFFTNYADESEGVDGQNGVGRAGPFVFSYNNPPYYISCRIRARYMRFYFYSNNFGEWWRLGGIRYRFQPDGRY